MLSETLTPSTATTLISRLKPKTTPPENPSLTENAVLHQQQHQPSVSPTPSTSSSAANLGILATIANSTSDMRANETVTTNGSSGGRSAALERAYVHDVYESCDEPVGSIRPKVAQFLAGLDPGSMVCDVGCGTGRYLNCNPLIYTMGVDRCYRLADVTKENGGEVTLCDNLELPFRDECFDAVLSVAVVHHFATTERRVGAIRELARILRIGGRVIITVWALEQKQRRFESQDVLIPWQQPKSRNSNFSDEEDEEDYLPPYHAYTGEDSTNSSRSAGDGDSSSLSSSSPGESCYSFVRRAIQKLAGNGKNRHPWFLDTWNSKDTKNGSSIDYEDAKDLPIELRRLEDFEDFPEPPLSAGLKSRSLGSILYPPPSRQIVRSRSSVPSLCGAHIPENVIVQCNSSQNYSISAPNGTSSILITTAESRRPRLVKQKQSLCEDDFPNDYPITSTNPFHNKDNRQLLRKQSSLNEELMAENRIREREKVKKRIQKQMSLNEAYLTRTTVFTRKLQVIRDGLTTKLKTSTGSLERATKSGLVKIIQNIKSSTSSYCSSENKTSVQEPYVYTNAQPKDAMTTSTVSVGSTSVISEEEQKERRHSRESGSDSSKDSLQSDTSIESEDSFASVIFIPKPDKPLNNEYVIATNRTPSSVPTSPQVMPCPPTPAHSPAPPRCKIQQQILMPEVTRFPFENIQFQKSDPLADNRLTTNQSAPGQMNSTRESEPKTCIGETKSERITKQVVKNLPQIPKFRKHFSINYPIVRRPTAAPALPKMCSMEIFNPETDDMDSDSSEPSSPDSIDSVISAFKPTITTSTTSTSTDVSSATGKSSAEDPDKIPEDFVKSNTIINEIEASKRDPNQPSYQTVNDNEIDRLQQNGEPHVSQKDLVDFAEKLSAQLLKEIDKTRPDSDDTSALLITDPEDELDNHNEQEPFPFRMEDPYIRKLNGEIKNIQSLREELRERRLMLANLNIQHYQSSSTIHEEDESPRDEVESLCNASITEDHKVDVTNRSLLGATSLRADSADGEFIQDDFAGIINSNDNLYVMDSTEIRTASSKPVIRHAIHSQLHSAAREQGPYQTGNFESRPSTESWAHSNSTASLDSPSAGGSSTHHRYYHVFREGELDALINHHVTSLHIVSSYYERASWCIVAEKVQVWTI